MIHHPNEMKAVLLPGPGDDLLWETIPVPKVEKGEVLVKIHATPINPSDLSFLTGKYTHIASYPVVPGIEGSGTVVASGAGILAKRLLGKKVVCSPSGKGGTWAQYMVTGAMKCIPISGKMDLDKAAMMIVNPLTALALIHNAIKNGHKGIVLNAAGSSLGRMLIQLARAKGLACVAVIRNPLQKEELLCAGASEVLDSGDKLFKTRLATSILQNKVSLALDAVSGSMTNTLLEALPKGGEVKIYGRLAGEFPEVHPGELIQNAKTISGFYLAHYLQQLSVFKRLLIVREAKKLSKSILASTIAKNMAMSDVNEAIDSYKKNMSKGKILLKPHIS